MSTKDQLGDRQRRILTTHAGSLPRPAHLQALHLSKSRGEPVDEFELEQAIEAATGDVISRQIDVGLDIINNGEVGRDSFFTYIQHRMVGFGGESSRQYMADILRYPGYAQAIAEATTESVTLMRAPQAISAIQYLDDSPIRKECADLARHLQAYERDLNNAFVSVPSPGIVAAAMQNAYYDSLDEYVAAVARALSTEYHAVADAGFILQIDAPDLATERHTLFQDKPLEEFIAFLRLVIDELNTSLAGIPAERIRVHVCWGNYPGPHDLDVPLADIWDELTRARVGGFLLSMANPRHAHEHRVLADGNLPDDVVVVPGVIDTTTNYIEHPEAVAERIERVSQSVGDPTRVVAGTDCGFETASGFATVDPDVAWEKLRSLTAGAALASERLFG